MATQVQFRRGTTTQNNAFTGAVGELTYDTEVKTLRIHDGTTAGGGSIALTTNATQTVLNKTFSTGSVWNGNPISLQYGGTGTAINPVAGAVAYGTANGIQLSAAGTSGQVLISGGTAGPSWINSTGLQTGTAVNATFASNVAGGSAGQLVIQQDSSLTTFITAGAVGTFLKSNGAGYAPGWATADITIGSTVIDLGSSATTLNGLNILNATGTSHWTLPVGTTAQRPASPAVGQVRYNSTQSTFEGYSSGAWSSLGGVKSVNAYTYILAETSAGAANGDLDFYVQNAGVNGSVQAGQWNRTRLAVLNGTASTSSTTGALVVTGGVGISGNAYVGGTLNVTGNLSVTGTTTTTNSQSLTVTTPQLFLASDNTGNSTDIGLIGAYVSSGNKRTGLVKQAASNEWRLFSNTTANPATVYDFTGAVYDNLRLGGIIGTGNSSIAGTLGVTGVTTLSSTLSVSGLITSSSGISGGPASFTTGTFSGAISATTGSFSGGVTASGGFQTSSDARLKSNIQDSLYGLDTVLALRSVTYTKDGKSDVGLIAQEVEAIIPEFVGENNDGMKTVNYSQMVSVLIKAVQELSAEVNTLKARLGE
jgi:hypothetical protein